MKFGPVPAAEALGCVLAHSLRLPDGVLKKGLLLGEGELQRITAAGIDKVVAVQLESGDVAEDAAAAQVAQALAGADADIGRASTGRVNVYARHPGLLMLDAARVNAANAVHEGLTIATLHPDSPVSAGQMLATVKIIPYAVPGTALAGVQDTLRGTASPESGRRALRVAAWRRISVGLIMTRLPDTSEAVLAKMRGAVAMRLEPLEAALVCEEIVTHDPDSVSMALLRLARSQPRPQLLLVSGIAATVDRQDVVPAAVVAAGGAVRHAGMPVDPGNLLVLAGLGAEDAALPVVGIPTCARSPKLNGFDFVLRRLAAGEPLTPADIMAMGVGGLLSEIESRPTPRDPRRS